MTNNDVPRYVISVAAGMVGVPSYTLRYYEKVGIMVPSRSRGNLRLYSDRDVVFLRRVKTLMEDLGINLAGVEVIMRMAQRVRELQLEVEKLESEMRRLRKAGSPLQGREQAQ